MVAGLRALCCNWRSCNGKSHSYNELYGYGHKCSRLYRYCNGKRHGKFAAGYLCKFPFHLLWSYGDTYGCRRRFLFLDACNRAVCDLGSFGHCKSSGHYQLHCHRHRRQWLHGQRGIDRYGKSAAGHFCQFSYDLLRCFRNLDRKRCEFVHLVTGRRTVRYNRKHCYSQPFSHYELHGYRNRCERLRGKCSVHGYRKPNADSDCQSGIDL